MERSGGEILVVRLWEPEPIDCSMCDAQGDWLHCVPYYCGPVAEGCSEGGYRSVCPTCHDKWARWNDSLQYYGA
jgi:hypothetical protein